MRYLRMSGCDLFVEIGPKPSLLGMARRVADDPSLRWIPTLRQGVSVWERIADVVTQLYGQRVARAHSSPTALAALALSRTAPCPVSRRLRPLS